MALHPRSHTDKPKQKFDNQAVRVTKAKAKVRELVKRGFRINREGASDTFLKATGPTIREIAQASDTIKTTLVPRLKATNKMLKAVQKSRQPKKKKK